MGNGEERRKARRMDLDVRVSMSRVDGDDEEISVEVLDISRAGIGFFCTKELVNGAVYKTDIKIWTGDVITAFINLVRVGRQENGNIYGGIFVGMPEADWCRIGVYETFQDFDEKGMKKQ
ncbi:MAG: PilZ domain-containing protein [Lachnospiraceae bacterium]|nr:PilZ domain-containing protein [Lachnospiraceae bacterium]